MKRCVKHIIYLWSRSVLDKIHITFNVGLQPQNYKMSTEGNVAIVTGATQGIGRAIATCLLSEGYKVKYIFTQFWWFFANILSYATISA